LILATVTSCKKKQASAYDESLSACGTINPIANLAWLNAEYQNLQGGAEINGIVVYRYMGEEVIEIQSSLSSSTNQHQYHCDGDRINLDDPAAFANYKRDRVELKILYGTKIW
jgi:hypothetical protein